MLFEGFIGPSNRQRSINFDSERTRNLYLEAAETGRPATAAALLNRPGLAAYLHVSAGPIRQMFSQDGRAFAVGGGVFVELFNNQTALIHGSVAVDSRPASICSNGQGGSQLLITSGGAGYLFDLDDNTLTQITDEHFPAFAVTGIFFDGYFMVLGADGTFGLSTLEDGAEWDGLDTGQESQVSDKTVMLWRTHDQLWLFGSKHIAPWYNSGNPSFPLQPVPGSIIEQGIVAPFSVQSFDNTVVWLGGNEQGHGVVWRANGFTPQRISTNGLETYLARLPRIDDAVGFTCQFDGHLFYGLYLPHADGTPVYDVSSNQWVEWTRWNPHTLLHEPFRGRCHTMAFGRHLFGDRASGTIYDARLDVYSDRVVVL